MVLLENSPVSYSDMPLTDDPLLRNLGTTHSSYDNPWQYARVCDKMHISPVVVAVKMVA
jgi:hypothetical protein